MSDIEAVLAGLVEIEVEGSNGQLWRFEHAGVTVGQAQAVGVGGQIGWQVTQPWRPGPICNLVEARRWLAEHVIGRSSRDDNT